jgi:hypothetical protein
MYITSVWWRGRYGRIIGETRAFGASDGQPGSIVNKGRSLVVDQRRASRDFLVEETRHDTRRWSVASGGAAR